MGSNNQMVFKIKNFCGYAKIFTKMIRNVKKVKKKANKEGEMHPTLHSSNIIDKNLKMTEDLSLC